jgi:hypothetical protein
MKQFIILLLAFVAIQSFGQTTNSNNPVNGEYTTKNQNGDTALRVIYADKNKPNRQPAIFVNEKYVMNQNFFATFDPNHIESIEVIKRDTLIENISYDGQIYIKTKIHYAPKFISLTDLKDKYTDFKGKPVVFMLDGNFVNANYDNYLVDESNLLTIIIDKLETDNEKIELGLVKLLTKTEENIKNRNRIILRGTEHIHTDDKERPTTKFSSCAHHKR